MRVEIEREPGVKRWAVWIVRDDGPDRWQWFPDVGGAPTWLKIESQVGERLPPSLRIDDEVWRPLIEAILELPDDVRPVADALNYERRVLDRLLAIVEGQASRGRL